MRDLSAPLKRSSLITLFTSSKSFYSGSFYSWESASRFVYIYRYTAICRAVWLSLFLALGSALRAKRLSTHLTCLYSILNDSNNYILSTAKWRGVHWNLSLKLTSKSYSPVEKYSIESVPLSN